MVCIGRCFIVTASGLIGLANESTQIEDEVVIFAGAQTPFVVRPLLDPESQSEEHTDTASANYDQSKEARVTESGKYKLVGECYIHGIIDGKDGPFDEEHKEYFELV